MSGHSRWSKVKHFQGVIDQRRGCLPDTRAPVTDPQLAGQVIARLEAPDDHDDGQAVHANLDLAPELRAKP